MSADFRCRGTGYRCCVTNLHKLQIGFDRLPCPHIVICSTKNGNGTSPATCHEESTKSACSSNTPASGACPAAASRALRLFIAFPCINVYIRVQSVCHHCHVSRRTAFIRSHHQSIRHNFTVDAGLITISPDVQIRWHDPVNMAVAELFLHSRPSRSVPARLASNCHGAGKVYRCSLFQFPAHARNIISADTVVREKPTMPAK